MKFTCVLFAAAAIMVATVCAIPSPQSNDPRFVCAWALTKWRYCHEAAGCDRDCPAGEACYKALCATPTSDSSDACTELRGMCGLEASASKRQYKYGVSVDEQFKPDDELFKPSVPHKPVVVDRQYKYGGSVNERQFGGGQDEKRQYKYGGSVNKRQFGGEQDEKRQFGGEQDEKRQFGGQQDEKRQYKYGGSVDEDEKRQYKYDSVDEKRQYKYDSTEEKR